MKKVSKEVIATKHIEVYEEDHVWIKKKAEMKGMSIRAYMHLLRVQAEKLNI